MLGGAHSLRMLLLQELFGFPYVFQCAESVFVCVVAVASRLLCRAKTTATMHTHKIESRAAELCSLCILSFYNSFSALLATLRCLCGVYVCVLCACAFPPFFALLHSIWFLSFPFSFQFAVFVIVCMHSVCCSLLVFEPKCTHLRCVYSIAIL